MRETLKLGGTLCILAFVVTLMLTFVNNLTKDVIVANHVAKTESALEQLVAGTDNSVESDGVYTCKKGEEILGYCVKTTVSGYGGEMELLVGFSKDKRILAYEILSHQETPGLGANAMGEGFIGRFNGKEPPVSVVKANPKGNEVEALTGATITSNAVAKAINDSVGRLP